VAQTMYTHVSKYKNDKNKRRGQKKWMSWTECLWLTPVILATQEAEISRIMARSQPGEKVRETLSWKSPTQNRAGGVAQGEDPEFKPQYCNQQKKKNEL
jgi:hypothetical protein